MRKLRLDIHDDIKPLEGKTIFKRLATRAIAMRKHDILLLYTKRYNDYSLPGGGVDDGEDIIAGLIRELKEETGATNISDIEPFGIYEEFRSWYKPEFDIVHMISHCYTCKVEGKLGSTKYEDYEIKNGMKPLWINIEDAILHNESVIQKSKKKGLSIERETFLLKLISKDLAQL